MNTLSFLRHYPYAAEYEDSALDCVRGSGAPGDTITASFSVVSSEDVGDAVFEVRELTKERHELEGHQGNLSSHQIAAESVEVYVAKIWEQAGLGRKQGARILVKELLVKDDRQPLVDRYRRGFKHWRQFAQAAMFYCPPDVRLSGPASTSLQAGVAKQIWLSIRVPDNAKPGIYRGVVAIRTREPLSEASLEIAVEVLDLRLSTPKQDLMIFYRGTLDVKRPQFFVSRKKMRQQLQDIFDHGFRSITIDERHSGLAQTVIDLCEDIGFDRHIVLMNARHLDKLRYRKLTPIVYVSDELDLQSRYEPNAALWHQRNNQLARQHGVKTMASLFDASCAAQLNDAVEGGYSPDNILYNLSTNRTLFQNLANSDGNSEKSTYYYWNSHMEKPDLHRILAGVYLWKSKCAGIAPYCYQHLPQFPFSPYDDFDEWEPGCNKSIPYVPLRDHCTVYPAKSGSIPTLQWEGMREGIIDLKYLTTLHEALEQARKRDDALSLVSEIEGRVAAFLERISLSHIVVNSEVDPKPYQGMNSEELQRFRDQMARDILALRRVNHPSTSAATDAIVC